MTFTVQIKNTPTGMWISRTKTTSKAEALEAAKWYRSMGHQARILSDGKVL